MGKNKNKTPAESGLLLPSPSQPPLAADDVDVWGGIAPIVDTHTHLHSTYSTYRRKYPNGKFASVHEFVRGVYEGRNVEAVVDVWCETPVQDVWKEIADSAVSVEGRARDWGGLEYYFVMGVHPHHTIDYTDAIEETIIEAMGHPRCVGLGEIGLDYHYMHSPSDVQRSIFKRQLKLAVRLGKPLTIHTREAEEDTELILKEEVPKDWKIHVHCFTDSPEFAQRLLDHFPNLYIGITGVITYSTNLNTPAVIRNMATSPENPLRILLETDAPYMVPANLYTAIPNVKGKLPLSHSAMIPWTAEFVAACANEASGGGNGVWDANRVMREARINAKNVYGV